MFDVALPMGPLYCVLDHWISITQCAILVTFHEAEDLVKQEFPFATLMIKSLL